MEYGELKTDEDFIISVENYQNKLNDIEKDLDDLCKNQSYDTLNTEDKVKYDLYISFCLNSLFWMFLRTKGVDPSKNGVKNELARVRQYMLRNKQVIERITLRPHLDKGAAGRFIRSGLWDKDNPKKVAPHSDVVDLAGEPSHKKARIRNKKKMMN